MKVLILFILTVLLIACSSVHKSNKDTVESLVILKVEVLTDGTVGRVVVIQSVMPGHGWLDEAAINSIKNKIFSPEIKDGNPIISWITLKVEFELKNTSK